MNIAIPAGGFGEASMNVSGNYENIMFLETLKEGVGEAKLDSINEVVSPFVGTSATVTGNLEDKDKSVILIVLKGDEWATDAALADAIVYIDTTVTFDDPVTTVDGTPDYKKGDVVRIEKTFTYEKVSTPPARYSMGTIINAMKNIASQIEDPELKKRMRE